MKRIFFGILVLTLVGLWIRPSMAQTITLRLGHVGFPGSLFAITTDEYAKRANAALTGKSGDQGFSLEPARQRRADDERRSRSARRRCFCPPPS